MKGSTNNNIANSVKLHKESNRIVCAIKKGATLSLDDPEVMVPMCSFTTKVNIGGWKKFELIVNEVAGECPETFVLLGAIVDPKLYVATITPSSGEPYTELITKSTETLNGTSNIAESSGHIRMGEIEFAADSNDTPFKAIDTFFALGANYLRKSGAVPEEEEEYEFGFDDI